MRATGAIRRETAAWVMYDISSNICNPPMSGLTNPDGSAIRGSFGRGGQG